MDVRNTLESYGVVKQGSYLSLLLPSARTGNYVIIQENSKIARPF